MVNLITEHIDIWSAAQTPKSNGAGRGNGSARHSLHGIKKLRELILELAVRGKLVPQDPNDPPASDLLEKIAREKARLFKEGKINKQKPLPEISEDEKPFELPEGWEWARLGDLSADIHYGYTASADEQIKNVRLLRITDIQNDSVNWESVPGCEIDENKISDYKLEEGDILIARTGGTIGKSYLVCRINLCAVFASYLIRVKRIEGMYPSFVKTYLGSQLYWKQLYANSMGTGQPNVNGNALKSLVFALPPLAEQHRIVAKVDELMALCDQLEQQQIESSDTHQILVETLLATLTNAADQKECAGAWQRIANHFDILFTTEQSIDQLKQTILQLAVMGKLVPQDPNDLPAPRPGKWLEGEIKAGRTRQAGLPAPRPGKWFVYVLECEDGSLYKGHSQDILKRWKQHASGEGSEWTKKHPPKRLVHWEAFNSQEEAVAREKELKSGYGRKWLEREIK
ncbi:MAG: restriction endonuclease subunit S, partial [Desulfobacterales bacterium]|nr:restriction endonuclease subunit S [Desulfobacterales bacterium]